MPTPLLCADLPGVAGTCPDAARDCEEILTRAPETGGSHLWLRVRKEQLGTRQVLEALARCARLGPDAFSCAGNRDRAGRCIQWFSVPRDQVDQPAPRPAAATQARMRVLDNTHGRVPITPALVGRLHWTLRLVGAGQGYQQARAILERLRLRGLPNALPFERGGNQLARWGRMLAHGRPLPGRVRLPRSEHGRCLRAFQEQLFNRYLAERVAGGLHDRCLPGELVRPRRGEDEIMMDAAAGQRRLDSWEAVPLGPLFGAGMLPAAGEAEAREQALLVRERIGTAALARLRGGRRATRAQPTRTQLDPAGADLELRCELPVDTHIACLLAEFQREDSLAEAEADADADRIEEADAQDAAAAAAAGDAAAAPESGIAYEDPSEPDTSGDRPA